MLVIKQELEDDSHGAVFEAVSVHWFQKEKKVLLYGTAEGITILLEGVITVLTVMGADIATYYLPESDHETDLEKTVAEGAADTRDHPATEA